LKHTHQYETLDARTKVVILVPVPGRNPVITHHHITASTEASDPSTASDSLRTRCPRFSPSPAANNARISCLFVRSIGGHTRSHKTAPHLLSHYILSSRKAGKSPEASRAVERNMRKLPCTAKRGNRTLNSGTLQTSSIILFGRPKFFFLLGEFVQQDLKTQELHRLQCLFGAQIRHRFQSWNRAYILKILEMGSAGFMMVGLLSGLGNKSWTV